MSSGPGRQPPNPDPAAPAANGTAETVLAVRLVRFGASDLSGAPDPNAWQHFGYDVDGLISVRRSADHCCPRHGSAPSSVKADGEDGIDNSFGSNLVPLLWSFAPDPEAATQKWIAQGHLTWLLRLTNLGPEPNQNHVRAAVYVAADRGALPKWDGTDTWPVTFDSTVGGNLNQPVVSLPESYVVDGTWVSGEMPIGAVFEMGIVMDPAIAPMKIHLAKITMKLSGVGATAKAVQGVISGVLDTEQVTAEAKPIAVQMDAATCSTDMQEFTDQFRLASDIMKDGTNGDPTKSCDAISIGLGFEASAAVLGGVAPSAPPAVDPCAG